MLFRAYVDLVFGVLNYFSNRLAHCEKYRLLPLLEPKLSPTMHVDAYKKVNISIHGRASSGYLSGENLHFC